MKEKIQTFSENLPKLTKQQAIVVVAISVVLALIFIFFLATSRNTDDSENRNIEEGDNAAYGFIIEGGPRVQKRELNSRTLQHSEEIVVGDEITNDSISKSMIIFSDNTYVVLDYNTVIELKSIQQGEESVTEFEIKVGTVYVRVTDNGLYDSAFNIVSEFTKVESNSGRFEVLALETGEVKISTKSGEVNVSTFDDDEESEKTLIEANKEITVTDVDNDLERLIADTGEVLEDSWVRLYMCIDNNVSQMLQGGNNEKLNFIKNQADVLVSCQFEVEKDKYKDEEEKRLSDARDKFDQDTENLSQQAPTVTSVTASYASSSISCSWNADGEEIEGYEYSIGTSAGSTDVFDWKETDSTSETVDIPGLDYGQFYYCNAKALGKYGDSAVKSSEGILYDNSSANIDSTSITFPPGPVKGDIENVQNIDDFDDLKVEIYIQNSDGEYLNSSGEWQDTQVLLSTSKSSENNNSFSFSSDSISGDSGDFNDGKLYIQVVNTLTGRTLDQTLVSIF